MSEDLIKLGAVAAHRLLVSGELTSVELVDAAARRIATVEPAVNALPTLCLERARAQAQSADRARRAPWGLWGGGEGSTTRIELQRPGDPGFRSFQEHYGLVSPSKFTNVRLGPGDRVRLVSPSGGGYGDPLERDPALVAADVRERFVSVASAERLYGVVLTAQGEVDEPATTVLRDRLRAERAGSR